MEAQSENERSARVMQVTVWRGPCQGCGHSEHNLPVYECPGCGYEGCPECIPAGDGCMCPDCDDQEVVF